MQSELPTKSWPVGKVYAIRPFTPGLAAGLPPEPDIAARTWRTLPVAVENRAAAPGALGLPRGCGAFRGFPAQLAELAVPKMKLDRFAPAGNAILRHG